MLKRIMKAAAILVAAAFVLVLAFLAYMLVPPYLDAERAVAAAEADGRIDSRTWQETVPRRIGEALVAVEFREPRASSCCIPGMRPVPSGVGVLARNLITPPERHIRRMLTEHFIAVRLLKTHTRDQLVDDYARTAWFGRDARGYEAGARKWFDKLATSLTLGESAFLVGTLRGPRGAERRAEQRRDSVLEVMHANGFISADEMSAAKAEPLLLVPE